VLLFI